MRAWCEWCEPRNKFSESMKSVRALSYIYKWLQNGHECGKEKVRICVVLRKKKWFRQGARRETCPCETC